jgi:geranylgeranyl diphosphate synthase type II
MGLAFQLQDDYLDVYGQQEVFGKRIGGDIATNKKTFLLISALEKANQNQRSRLLNLLEEPNIEKKIKEVTELYNEIGVDKDIKEKIKYYSNKAVALLDEISNQRTTHQIKSIIIKLINRSN